MKRPLPTSPVTERIKDQASCTPAPEICVEVVSPSNSDEEMLQKKDLYLGAGAKEVWLCGEHGRLTFFSGQARMPRSILCPTFPHRVGTIGNGSVG